MNLKKVTIYLLTSCNTEERIAQNILQNTAIFCYTLFGIAGGGQEVDRNFFKTYCLPTVFGLPSYNDCIIIRHD